MKQRDQAMQRAMDHHEMRMTHFSRLCLGAALVLGASSVATLAHADTAYDAADWPMYNYDPAGTRYNAAESTLGTGNVSGLHILWQYPTPAPVSGTPVVVNGVVYAGDMAGFFYALRSSDGALVWSRQLQGQVTASALVTKKRVVVGDINGNMYGLDRTTGAIVWSMRPDPHPLAAIWGSPTPVGDYVAIGIASNEETAAGDDTYPCCSSRGSMVVFEPNSGEVVWQTFTVSDAEKAAGASGSSIWSTPTYDAKNGLIYATTGNNFSQPTNGTSDAFVAFDVHTGKIRWVNQRFPNDEWNFSFPFSPEHPDADFGDSAQLYTLSDGRKVVGAGQKSGFYHVVDAKSGALIFQKQYQPGGTLGGLFSDSAVANGVVYQNAVNWPAPGAGAPVAGDLIAIAGDGSHQVWRFTTQYTSTLGSPDFGGVAVANGVVYFTSWGIPFDPLDIPGRLYALNAATGALLTSVSLGAGVSTSTSGPAVSRGRVYVGTGDAISAAFGFGSGPGTITAMGL
jgi:polyvinyl alcohol dehydrogenase (cytochrome)